jgi:hypothetical protein
MCSLAKALPCSDGAIARLTAAVVAIASIRTNLVLFIVTIDNKNNTKESHDIFPTFSHWVSAYVIF